MTLLSALLALSMAGHTVPPVNFDTSQRITHASRKLSTISISANGGESQTFSYWSNHVYNDRTERPPFSAPVGAEVSVNVNYNDTWMHTYVYIDRNGDGELTPNVGDGGAIADDSELLAFSYYRCEDQSGTAGYNSLGERLEGDAQASLQAPAFRLPEDLAPGFYLMRIKIDWDDIDAGGSQQVGNDIVKNGGAIYDLRIRVYDPDEPCAFTVTQPSRGGTLRVGSLTKGTAAYGSSLRINCSRSSGFELDNVVIRHGNLSADSIQGGVVQWQVDTVDASYFTNGATCVLPTWFADGDFEVSGTFLTTEERAYYPVFEDNFDGSEIDYTYWVRAERTSPTWCRWISKTEKEHALTGYVENGNLVLRAVPNPYTQEDNVAMVTGALWTRGTWDFKYGYAEARLRCLKHTGNFPAFWLMPTDASDGWPDCGEIDIWETIDNQNTAYQTVHTYWGNTLGQSNNPRKSYSCTANPEDYHTYALEWTPAYLRWFVDDVQVGQYDRTWSDWSIWQERGQWPYDKPFYLIINQSVGNNAWAAMADTSFTYEMQVDYIKVSQRRASPTYTGIETPAVEAAASAARADKTLYDLSGRRIQRPAHGVYIQAGRKVIR